MAEYDRRHFRREITDETIQVLPIPGDFKYNKDSCDFMPAKMVNQSEEGLHIEIDRNLQSGSNVRIKMVSPQTKHPEKTYHISDGQVIWCEKVDGTTSRFGAGIKILRKAIQAQVLTSRFK